MTAQVKLIKDVKISDKGLFFDGKKVSQTAGNNGAQYDYVFGNRITPHGDCIKEYNGYVFMTWYQGGKSDRRVMLSRYNPNTGSIKTIQFPHRHNGFQNKAHLGESHNTIAIGISPIDGTIHMVYDIHSYSENRPSNGSLKNDYYRYSYSKKNIATISDSEFTLDKFVKTSSGLYKHLKMNSSENYKSLTYPNFFLNNKGELFLWVREGGNNNGAYKFCKYTNGKWSNFTQFNILNAKNRGLSYNWGLYGDIKFESGKMRIGFHIRANNNGDKYLYNNGFYYGYSDDENGLKQWKNHKGDNFSLPLINPQSLKISEPGDVVKSLGTNSVKISRGSDWTVTDKGDIHFVSAVSTSKEYKNVHTYKKAGNSTFQTSTSFPGGDLYTYGNDVYLIGLQSGRVFIEKTAGGTNNWKTIYKATSGKKFRFGNVSINKGKVYFYLMEQKSGSAQPIYLQIIDLGLGNTPEPVATVNKINNVRNVPTSVKQGETVTIAVDYEASASQEIVAMFQTDTNPWTQYAEARATVSKGSGTKSISIPIPGNTPAASKAYQIQIFIAPKGGVWNDRFANKNNKDITVVQSSGGGNPTPPTANQNPTVSFKIPSGNSSVNVGYKLNTEVAASDADGSVANVNLYINDKLIRQEKVAPYEWGHANSPNPNELNGLSAGTYTIKAVATDNDGATAQDTFTLTVKSNGTPNPTPTPTPDTNCAFETPISGGLPSFNRASYSNIYVLGNGPNVSNLRQFRINWDAGSKKLMQFAFNTKNGNPDYYIDLRSKISHNFGSSKPAVKISGSGIGIDGDYWVTKRGNDFVMASKGGKFTIYCSTSSSKPSCTGQKVALQENAISVFPNPAQETLNISGLTTENAVVTINDLLGKVVLTTSLTKGQNSLNVSNLKAGFYIVSFTLENGTISQKTVVVE